MVLWEVELTVVHGRGAWWGIISPEGHQIGPIYMRMWQAVSGSLQLVCRKLSCRHQGFWLPSDSSGTLDVLFLISTPNPIIPIIVGPFIMAWPLAVVGRAYSKGLDTSGSGFLGFLMCFPCYTCVHSRTTGSRKDRARLFITPNRMTMFLFFFRYMLNPHRLRHAAWRWRLSRTRTITSGPKSRPQFE
jgi:hypothetical protein